jgi:hypothetical protein
VRAVVIVPSGATVLRDRDKRGRYVSVGSSIVEVAGSIRKEPEAEHHLREEKTRDSLRSYSTVMLGPRVGYPLRRAPIRISQNLAWFRIPR